MAHNLILPLTYISMIMASESSLSTTLYRDQLSPVHITEINSVTVYFVRSPHLSWPPKAVTFKEISPEKSAHEDGCLLGCSAV
jgi:hypothetical protein